MLKSNENHAGGNPRAALETINSVEGFNPSSLLITLASNGETSMYLKVQDRIGWFRLVYPKGAIVSELNQITNGVCIMQASIYSDATNKDSSMLARGYGSFVMDDSDYGRKAIECAETSAIGRALAAAGFGTQFCGGEMDLPDPVDSGIPPVSVPTTPKLPLTPPAKKILTGGNPLEKKPSKEKETAVEKTEKKESTPVPGCGKSILSALSPQKDALSFTKEEFDAQVKQHLQTITKVVASGVKVLYGPQKGETLRNIFNQELGADKMKSLRPYASEEIPPECLADSLVVAAAQCYVSAYDKKAAQQKTAS